MPGTSSVLGAANTITKLLLINRLVNYAFTGKNPKMKAIAAALVGGTVGFGVGANATNLALKLKNRKSVK